MSFTRYAPVAVPVIVALICLIIMLSNHDSHQIYQKPNGLDYQNDDLVNEVYDFLRASRYDDSINYEDEDFDSKRDVLSDNTPTKYTSNDRPRNISFADPSVDRAHSEKLFVLPSDFNRMMSRAFDGDDEHKNIPEFLNPAPPTPSVGQTYSPMLSAESRDPGSDSEVSNMMSQAFDDDSQNIAFSVEPSVNIAPPMPSISTEDEANLYLYPAHSMLSAESSDSESDLVDQIHSIYSQTHRILSDITEDSDENDDVNDNVDPNYSIYNPNIHRGPEDSDSTEDIDEKDDVKDTDHESTGWACKTCTYINSPLLNSCEMCYTPKNHIQNDSPFMAAADPIVDEIVDQIFDDPNPDINVDQIHDNHDRHHHSTEDNEEKHVSDQESDEKVCAICFDDLSPESRKTVTGECNHNHIFHTDCMDTWIKRKNICPLCRAEWKPKVFVSDNLEAVLIKWFNKLNFAPKRASNMARGFIEGLKANTDLDDKDNFVEDLNGSPDDSELVEMLSKLIIDTGNFDQSVIKNYVFNLLNSCLDDMYPQWQFQDNNGNWRDFYGVAGERAELAYSQRDVKAQPATVDVACRNCAWRGYSFDFENMIETSLANRDNWFRIRRTH
eukprot:511276_1